MKTSSSLLSPPPSPHLAPLPLSSTSLSHCPELDLSVTLSPAHNTSRTHQRPRPPKTSVPSHMKPRPRGQTVTKRNPEMCFEEPVVVTVTPEPHIQFQHPVRGRHHAANQYPGCLERVELNTTLALKAELQSLQEEEFNPQRAVQETLRRSERTKKLISTRATEVVNVSRSQHLFTSLVSVTVQADDLISEAMQDRLLLAPPPHCHDKATDGPSLLPFMTSALLRQKPLPPKKESVDQKPRPSLWPTHSTFDLFSRQKCWEAAP